jgi:hypothetical protein
LNICVAGNTTTLNVINDIYGNKLKTINLTTGENIVQGLLDGSCEVIAAGLGEVLLAQELLTEKNSSITLTMESLYDGVIEPLALVTRQDDTQWSDFVALVVTATFDAEEKGISVDNWAKMPEVHLFGSQFTDMLRTATSVVGSYKDIYERNIKGYERSGLNLLYSSKNSSTPLLYSPHDLRIAKD